MFQQRTQKGRMIMKELGKNDISKKAGLENRILLPRPKRMLIRDRTECLRQQTISIYQPQVLSEIPSSQLGLSTWFPLQTKASLSILNPGRSFHFRRFSLGLAPSPHLLCIAIQGLFMIPGRNDGLL